jgi:hypothetical protein
VKTAFEVFKGDILPKLRVPKNHLSDLLRTVDKLLDCDIPSDEHESIEYHHTVMKDLKSELVGAHKRLSALFKIFEEVRSFQVKKETLKKKQKLLSGFAAVEGVVQSITRRLDEPDPSLCTLQP